MGSSMILFHDMIENDIIFDDMIEEDIIS